MMKKRYDEVLLVAGTAVFRGEEKIRKALMYWQKFANQKGNKVPLPGKLFPQVLGFWAEAVFEAAFEGEPWVPPPRARVVTLSETSISLIWEGTFTKGRFVEATFNNDGNEPVVFLKWKTGTGRRSRFLSVEKALDFADSYESAVDLNNNVARSHWKEHVTQTHWAALSSLM